MNPVEIAKGVFTDFDQLYNTPANRPGGEYVREWKKLKIDKAWSCVKTYTVKAAAKNPWILYVREAPAVDKYKDEYSNSCRVWDVLL